MKTFTCSTQKHAQDALQFVMDGIKKHGRMNVAATHKTMRAEELSIRTLNQNSMKEAQVNYIASQLYGGDEHYTRLELKYRVGVPILCRADPKFLKFCEMALKHLIHEDRIKAMEYVSITSEMGVNQMSEYIKKVFDMYAEQVDWGAAAWRTYAPLGRWLAEGKAA